MKLNSYDNVFNISVAYSFSVSSVKHVGGGAHKSSCYRVGESGRKANELRVLLAKIEESEVCTFLSVPLLLKRNF